MPFKPVRSARAAPTLCEEAPEADLAAKGCRGPEADRERGALRTDAECKVETSDGTRESSLLSSSGKESEEERGVGKATPVTCSGKMHSSNSVPAQRGRKDTVTRTLDADLSFRCLMTVTEALDSSRRSWVPSRPST